LETVVDYWRFLDGVYDVVSKGLAMVDADNEQGLGGYNLSLMVRKMKYFGIVDDAVHCCLVPSLGNTLEIKVPQSHVGKFPSSGELFTKSTYSWSSRMMLAALNHAVVVQNHRALE
jgi:hypothetical protein